nr:hypothetical protein [Tanacetum cinerariifolium]
TAPLSPAITKKAAAPSLPAPKKKPPVPVKPPHPNTKYLSQILSVPKPDQLYGDDDLEWLFNRKEGKKPPAEDPQLEYFRAIGCLMYAMVSTRSDIAFTVGKLSSGYPSVIEGYSDASRINYMEDHSSMSAGNAAEWLTNLIYEIPLWPKSISTISIRCDSVVTLAKAYSQVYNGKSRQLDHLTKGLARYLIRKAAIGMGLKST